MDRRVDIQRHYTEDIGTSRIDHVTSRAGRPATRKGTNGVAYIPVEIEGDVFIP